MESSRVIFAFVYIVFTFFSIGHFLSLANIFDLVFQNFYRILTSCPRPDLHLKAADNLVLLKGRMSSTSLSEYYLMQVFILYDKSNVFFISVPLRHI